MKFYQRVCFAVGRYGISGLPRRLARKWGNADCLAELEWNPSI
jgi:hypothetical protein